MADVVVSLCHADVELGVRWNVKALTDAGSLPFVASIELVFTGASHAFHDLCSSSSKRQRSREYHTHRLLGAIGQSKAVADALAIKVDIGLGGQGNAGKLLGGHGERAVAEVGSKLSILGP